MNNANLLIALAAGALFAIIVLYILVAPICRTDAYKAYRRLSPEEREVFINWCTMRDFNPFLDATMDEWERVRDKFGFKPKGDTE